MLVVQEPASSSSSRDVEELEPLVHTITTIRSSMVAWRALLMDGVGFLRTNLWGLWLILALRYRYQTKGCYYLLAVLFLNLADVAL